MWCSRVLKGQLSGDILSPLILKESSKSTWWWYLIQVSLVYPLVTCAFKPISLSLPFLLSYLRSLLWSSFQGLRSASRSDHANLLPAKTQNVSLGTVWGVGYFLGFGATLWSEGSELSPLGIPRGPQKANLEGKMMRGESTLQSQTQTRDNKDRGE